MTGRNLSSALALLAVCVLAPISADAQVLGTFRWQLQSYCNVLSLVVVQSGGVFTLDGFDDQCGAVTRAPVTGLATPNPNGTIEFGLTIVATPGAAPVHVAAAISLATLGGTWRDSAGNTGNFVFTPGTATGGSPRPATGTIGAVAVNSSQVQLRIEGSCPGGRFMRSVTETGAVTCASGLIGLSAGAGLAGGGTAGTVLLRLRQTSSGAFDFGNGNSGFVSSGSDFDASIPVAESGPGTRLLWHPARSAFRAGRVGSTQWDLPNIGFGSVAMGLHTRASGDAAFAMGTRAEAAGVGSVALGSDVIATANAPGTFIFADRSTTDDFIGSAPNEFGVRAAGGVYFYTSSNLSTGCSLPAGSGTWACASDRNSKEHFAPVDGEMVLTKLRAMPVERWSYKSEPGVSHMGPVAQDFHAAFGLGVDDKTIGHFDLSGIALRAIQALELRTRDVESVVRENAELKATLSVLQERLARLEAKQQ